MHLHKERRNTARSVVAWLLKKLRKVAAWAK
jgi:hypothetical protein